MFGHARIPLPARSPRLAVLFALGVAGCLEKGDLDHVAAGPVGDTPCEQYCNHVADSPCDPVADCEETCEAWQYGKEQSRCLDVIDDYIDCMLSRETQCSADGKVDTRWCILPDDCIAGEGCSNADDCVSCCVRSPLSASDVYFDAAYECWCSECAEECSDFCAAASKFTAPGRGRQTLLEYRVDDRCQACAQELDCGIDMACAEDSSCSPFMDCLETCP